MLENILHSILPPIWVALGPLLTAGITKLVNKVATTFVPRFVQTIISGVLMAAVAGLTGDMAGVDTTIALSLGGVSGVTGQILAATSPKTLLTEAKAS